jgi:hypothetical protein
MGSRAFAQASIAAFIVCACSGNDVRVVHTPAAFAGYDTVATVGAKVPLDGSQSMDPDGRALTFAWRLEATPSGSTASIDAPNARVTSFVPDLPGSYVASLTVSNGSLFGRDLIAIFARTATMSAAPSLQLALTPAICNVDADHPEMNSCGAPAALAITPNVGALSPAETSAARIVWTLFRMPPGSTLLNPDSGMPVPLGPFSLTIDRAGEYWIAGALQLAGGLSPIALSSIGVYSGSTPIGARPTARIVAHDHAKRDERVLFDGSGSTVPPPPMPGTPHFQWTLVVDPSKGADALTDAETGCPQDQCRVLLPSAAGTYVIGLHIQTGDVDGATALVALEVN